MVERPTRLAPSSRAQMISEAPPARETMLFIGASTLTECPVKSTTVTISPLPVMERRPIQIITRKAVLINATTHCFRATIAISGIGGISISSLQLHVVELLYELLMLDTRIYVLE